jgi:alpha-beta hydrolase superfamily lysophospholipase
VNPDWLSHDPAVGRAYQADPLVSHAVSAGWHRALQHAIGRAHAQAGAWSSPLLVVASHGDHIVDARAIARWVAGTPAGIVEARYWDDLHHEIFNETANADVFAVVESWLDRTLAGRRSAVQP